MAIGVIIGAAFGKIVTSLVNDIIMPVIGVLTSGLDFKDMKLILKKSVMDGEMIIKPEVTLSYGNFVQTVADFLIVAFSIFMVVKIINNMRKKFEREKEIASEIASETKPATELDMLTEIRDLIKNDRNREQE
jgi:large conductance mechanosensitive channel